MTLQSSNCIVLKKDLYAGANINRKLRLNSARFVYVYLTGARRKAVDY